MGFEIKVFGRSVESAGEVVLGIAMNASNIVL